MKVAVSCCDLKHALLPLRDTARTKVDRANRRPFPHSNPLLSPRATGFIAGHLCATLFRGQNSARPGRQSRSVDAHLWNNFSW